MSGSRMVKVVMLVIFLSGCGGGSPGGADAKPKRALSEEAAANPRLFAKGHLHLVGGEVFKRTSVAFIKISGEYKVDAGEITYSSYPMAETHRMDFLVTSGDGITLGGTFTQVLTDSGSYRILGITSKRHAHDESLMVGMALAEVSIQENPSVRPSSLDAQVGWTKVDGAGDGSWMITRGNDDGSAMRILMTRISAEEFGKEFIPFD